MGAPKQPVDDVEFKWTQTNCSCASCSSVRLAANYPFGLLAAVAAAKLRWAHGTQLSDSLSLSRRGQRRREPAAAVSTSRPPIGQPASQPVSHPRLFVKKRNVGAQSALTRSVFHLSCSAAPRSSNKTTVELCASVCSSNIQYMNEWCNDALSFCLFAALWCQLLKPTKQPTSKRPPNSSNWSNAKWAHPANRRFATGPIAGQPSHAANTKLCCCFRWRLQRRANLLANTHLDRQTFSCCNNNWFAS